MLVPPHRDEAQAEELASLADALDAGISADALFGSDAAGGGITPALAARGACGRDPVLREVFAAAESAGRLPAALRTHAAALRHRAELKRETWASLRYPFLLVLMATFAATVSRIAYGGWVLGALLVPLLVIGLMVLAALLTPAWSRRWPVPVLGPLLREHGELRYLEVLHALYASGIPILAAHERATSLVTPDWVRIPYARATLLLGESQLGLGEALARAAALSPETRGSILSGEKAGELEATLARLITYRRATAARRTARAVRLAAWSIGAIAATYAIWTIVSFYSGYLGRLSSLRGR